MLSATRPGNQCTSTASVCCYVPRTWHNINLTPSLQRQTGPWIKPTDTSVVGDGGRRCLDMSRHDASLFGQGTHLTEALVSNSTPIA